MKILAFLLLLGPLVANDDEFPPAASVKERLTTMLTGKTKFGEQDIGALGVDSIATLTTLLESNKDQGRLPIYCRILYMYRGQFAATLSSEKVSRLLTLLSARIREIEDAYPMSNFIQGSLDQLRGINDPLIIQLADFYAQSPVEWTRDAAGRLRNSIIETPQAMQNEPVRTHRAMSNSNGMPSGAVPATPTPEPNATPLWCKIVVLVVAAAACLLWWLFKRRP